MTTKTPSLLVTGGCGFIGSHLLELLLNNTDFHIINLDKITYAGNLDNTAEFNSHPRYTFVQDDICNQQILNQLFTDYDIQGVFHLAAESHVDNSISGPEIFIDTNVKGSFILLHTAYSFWMDGPNKIKESYKNARFVHVSTDEVYGSLGDSGYFTEISPYAPNSPYSASKASSDMIARSYFETYGLNVVITNCSNNFGPKQHNEKLIPTIIRNALNETTIPIYGDGKNIRDWLFVKDHCNALKLIFEKGRPGQVYVIGGDQEYDNLSLSHSICNTLDSLYSRSTNDSYVNLIRFVEDRHGHDRRYAIDSSKLKSTLNWKKEYSFEESLLSTINWYVDNFKF